MIKKNVIRLWWIVGGMCLLRAVNAFPVNVGSYDGLHIGTYRASESPDSWNADPEKEAKTPFWKRLFKKEQPEEEPVHPDLHEFTLEQNRLVPAVSAKALPQIRRTTTLEVRRLSKIKQMKVSSERDGEVIKIEIPMSQLFQPNDTALWSQAGAVLQPLVRYLRVPDYYHILVVAHSDDSGSAAYTGTLTRKRVLAVQEWLLAYGALPEFVIAYAAGSQFPLTPNTSETNRERNRRLEIYLVPGEELIGDAEKGKITL